MVSLLTQNEVLMGHKGEIFGSKSSKMSNLCVASCKNSLGGKYHGHVSAQSPCAPCEGGKRSKLPLHLFASLHSATDAQSPGS